MESAHPFQRRGRVRPWVALKNLARAMRNPEDTESGARFVFALNGNHAERVFQRFRSHPDGARLLRERPSLLAALSDLERLRALPPGTLGHAYARFMDEEHLSAQGLVDVTAAVADPGEHLDAERRFVDNRVGEMHDLWHVVTGYSRDLVGEIALIAFSYKQLGTPAFLLLCSMSFAFTEFKVPGARALLRGAWRRGRDAVWLPVQDWEQLLELPLDEVRSRLGVGPPVPYTRYFRVGYELVAEGAA